MSDPFLGQIEIFAFRFAPKGWALCNGQLMSIAQNPQLFQLLGTTYGGDGRINFALPDLQSRTPIGQTEDAGRTPYPVGTKTGEETHAMTADEATYHGHSLSVVASPDVTKNSPMPGGDVALSKATASDAEGHPIAIDLYVWDYDPVKKVPLNLPKVAMADAAIGMAGGQPHANMMPYLVLNPCISLQGPMPSPN
jgi:microcystin-dependent protein